MPITVALIAGAVAGGSAIYSSNSARKAAREANVAGANLNRENRDWQEYMAGSAHQREVADLRAAGLNPILSGTGGGGAPTPGNSAFTPAAEPASSIGDPGGAASSAYAARQQQKLMDATTEKAEHEAGIASDNELSTARDRAVTDAKLAYLQKSEDRKPMNKQEELWEAEFQSQLTDLEIKKQAALQGPVALEAKRAELKRLLQETNIGASAESRAKIEDQINQSSMGEVLMWIDRLSRSVQGARNSVY